MSFHKAARDTVLLVYPKEILIVDLEIGQTVGCVIGGGGNSSASYYDSGSDGRNSGLGSSIIQVYPCAQRDALYLLHENGTISLRARRGIFTKAAVSRSSLTRSISMTSSLVSFYTTSSSDRKVRRDSLDGPSNVAGTSTLSFRDDVVLEISYELIGATTDTSIKLGSGAKGAKVRCILKLT